MSAALTKYRPLFNYAVLTYMDRLLLFVVPLIFYAFFSQVQYARVEYIFSISSLLLPLADLGLRNYMFYHYKIAKGSSEALNLARGVFSWVSALYCFLLLVFLGSLNWLYACIAARLLYSMVSSYLVYWYRLNDRPSRCYYYSIAVSLGCALYLAVAYVIGLSYLVLSYHLILAISIFLLFPIKILVLRPIKAVSIVQYLFNALKFAWPIILNLFIVLALANFSKIYIYNTMSANDMSLFSIIQRASYALVMVHTSLQGYYSKALYMEEKVSNYVKLYVFVMLTAAIIGALILAFILIDFEIMQIRDLWIFVPLILYTLCWCFSSFVELFFAKNNKNIYVLFINVISVVVFFALFLARSKTLAVLSFNMMAAMFCSFALSLILYQRLRRKMKLNINKSLVVKYA